ncbi:hypothetical protein [Neobacillus soli]|uniref:hypothetical protein n=1 Tax=Neobacillus soli TaxID=220688 RepID=UPI0008263496|nr:hypothetical protein [Neobacillus soli]
MEVFECKECFVCGLLLINGIKNPGDFGIRWADDIYTGERYDRFFHWDRGKFESEHGHPLEKSLLNKGFPGYFDPDYRYTVWLLKKE